MKKKIKGILIILNKIIWRVSDGMIHTLITEANSIPKLGGFFAFDPRKGVIFKKK